MTSKRDLLIAIGLALAGGVAMRFAFGLHPIWWLAWLAPAPLLMAALRGSWRQAGLLSFVASLIATSALFHYFSLLMPLPAAILVVAILALLWTVVVMLTRRIVLRLQTPWAVLAYPLLWCAFDTLLAYLHPDSNWSSPAYSQAAFLPAVQILALAGTAGLVFVLSLVPSVLAVGAQRGLRQVRAPTLLALVLVGATFGYGAWRMPAAPPPAGELVGMAVIDAWIGPQLPALERERIWAQYERHVETLAAQGARIIVLPEKIATMPVDEATRLQARLAALAARTRTTLAVGMDVDDGQARHNLLWLFGPDGKLDATYQKHHLAPPEREFARGAAYDLRTIGATRVGLAICKDMHFAAMGRAYGTRGAQVMLVPAWDFGVDGDYGARLSALRGVESGFAMVRAAREGLLTISDAYGRISVETHSSPLPGAVLLGRVPAGPPIPTLYARTGDLFGWLSTGAALLMLILAQWTAGQTYRRAPAD